MRSFIAIPIPEHVCGELEDVFLPCRKRNLDLRWTRPEHFHLTLHFLGEVEQKKIDLLIDAFRQSTFKLGFKLAIEGIGVFPALRSPRVLWAGFTGDLDLLQKLHADIQNPLQKLAIPFDEKPFSPHLTLARFKREDRRMGSFDRLAQKKIEECVERYSKIKIVDFSVETFAVFESVSTSEGSKYEMLWNFKTSIEQQHLSV